MGINFCGGKSPGGAHSPYAASAISIRIISDERDWIVRCRSACWACCTCPIAALSRVSASPLFAPWQTVPGISTQRAAKPPAPLGSRTIVYCMILYISRVGIQPFLLAKAAAATPAERNYPPWVFRPGMYPTWFLCSNPAVQLHYPDNHGNIYPRAGNIRDRCVLAKEVCAGHHTGTIHR